MSVVWGEPKKQGSLNREIRSSVIPLCGNGGERQPQDASLLSPPLRTRRCLLYVFGRRLVSFRGVGEARPASLPPRCVLAIRSERLLAKWTPQYPPDAGHQLLLHLFATSTTEDAASAWLAVLTKAAAQLLPFHQWQILLDIFYWYGGLPTTFAATELAKF